LLAEGLMLLSGSFDGLMMLSGKLDVIAASASSAERDTTPELSAATIVSTCPGCRTIVIGLGTDAACLSPLVVCFILHLLGLSGLLNHNPTDD
jgi:hypothetical protein